MKIYRSVDDLERYPPPMVIQGWFKVRKNINYWVLKNIWLWLSRYHVNDRLLRIWTGGLTAEERIMMLILLFISPIRGRVEINSKENEGHKQNVVGRLYKTNMQMLKTILFIAFRSITKSDMKGLTFSKLSLGFHVQYYETKRVVRTQHGTWCCISKKIELLSWTMDLSSVRKWLSMWKLSKWSVAHCKE